SRRGNVGEGGVKQARKIALLEGGYGQGAESGRSVVTDARSLQVVEEECLVFSVVDFGQQDGSAYGITEVIGLVRLAFDAACVVAPTVGTECFVLRVPIAAAMQPIGTAFGREVGDRGRTAAILSSHHSGLKLELTD